METTLHNSSSNSSNNSSHKHAPSSYPKLVKEIVRWKLLSKKEVARRAGHACTGIPNTPFMYAYGGSKDNIGSPLETQQLVMYDYDKGIWTDHNSSFSKPELPAPLARIGHSLVGVTDGRIIGSEIVHLLDKSSQQHMQVRHSALLVFGGWSTATRPTNELWKYNTLTNTWHDLTSIQTGMIPSPRTNHSCVIIDDKMIIFGGLGEKPDDAFCDTYILDLNHLTWKAIGLEGEPGVDYPHKSRSHACAVHRKRMILFGGGSDKVCYNNLWAFDLLVERWLSIPTQEPRMLRELKRRQQEQRERQATSLDLIAELGVIPTAVFKEPEPRLFCVGAIADMDQFYVFGGRNGKQRINETWKFDFESNEWTLLEFGNISEIQQVIAPSPEEDDDEASDAEEDQIMTDVRPKARDKPAPRSGCCMSTVTSSDGKTKMLLFGGSTWKSKSSELWELQVQSEVTRSNLLKIVQHKKLFVDIEIITGSA